MKIQNNDYGGFIVSKNIMNGEPIRYSYRERAQYHSLMDGRFIQ